MPDTTHSITVAAFQFATVKGDVEQNLSTMIKAASDARTAGVELLVYPELCTTGYDAADRFSELAEAHDGPVFQRLSAVAKDLGIALCYGYAERDDQLLYNSAQVIDHHGQSIQHHRKSHLYGAYEHQWFQPGDSPGTTAEYSGFKLTTLICYEIEFPELARFNAQRGSNIFLVPTAVQSQPGIDDVTHVQVKARATENNAFVVYANHAAGDSTLNFMGRSIIAGPGANTCAVSEDANNALLVSTLTKNLISTTQQVLPYLQDLRPTLFTA